jgi:hypothetical protein
MMDRELATAVALSCVKKVGGHRNVSEDETLRHAGIGSEGLLSNLRNVITNDSSVGVPSKSFKIDPNTLLSLDGDSEVGDVSDTIAEKAEARGPRG